MTLIDTGGTDVVDMLTTDHREMLELLRRIERTEDLDERRDIADTVIAEVMRHSVAEEMIVYPSIRRSRSTFRAGRTRSSTTKKSTKSRTPAARKSMVTMRAAH